MWEILMHKSPYMSEAELLTVKRQVKQHLLINIYRINSSSNMTLHIHKV